MPKYQNSKTVRCPKCQSVLSVPNKKDVEKTTFNCPKCKHLLLVKFHLAEKEPDTIPPVGNQQDLNQQVPLEAHTEIASPPSNSPKGIWPHTPGVLFCNGMAKPLHVGKNTCGRAAASSMSQHQFPTDGGVSKEHFDINVKQHADGTFLVTLALHKPHTSFTSVDKLPVIFGDEIVLREGSVIVASQTTFIYSTKQS